MKFEIKLERARRAARATAHVCAGGRAAHCLVKKKKKKLFILFLN